MGAALTVTRTPCRRLPLGVAMDVRSPLLTPRPDSPSLTERAEAVLRDEMAGGALANIAAASQVWSAHRRDLVGEPAGRIRASRLRLAPGRVRVPSGALADLTIALDVPDDARPGLYHA